MSESASPLKVCFNPQCGASAAEKWRKGWTLRSGDIVELCERCGSAYEEQTFCEDFHADVAGWRNCETCGKRLHCGCIASVHKYYLLDAGGVECIVCANKNVPGVSLFRPPSWFPSLSHLDGLTDQSSKVWGQIPVTGSNLRQQQQPPFVWHYMSQHSESYPGMRHPDAGKPSDRFPGEVWPVTGFMEKRNVGDSHEKDSDNSHNYRRFHIYDNLGNRISDVAYKDSLGASIQEAYIDGLRDPSYIAGSKSNEVGKDISAEERGRIKSVNISKCEPQESYLNIQQLPSLLKDDISNVSAPSLPFSRESNLRHSNDAQQQRYLQSSPKQNFSACRAGPGSSMEKQSKVRATRPSTDGKVKNQSINRYCPRITVQELQKISGNSNCVVTPLFEKMLSASDAGRVGRLVLPKKCAEAYFPAISHPEGLPLKIQDANGKEWVFQFRFWPNNNSRMYVLEGVTSCIQSMQLQAGDIVTFSRIDPEGKLVMGFRKASNTLSHQDERSLESQNGEVPNRVGGCNEVVTALPAYSAKGAFDSTHDSSCDQIGPVSVVSYLDKTSKPKVSSGSAAFLLDKRKKRTSGSKRVRLSVDDENSAKMKPTWEEAQKLLQPPPNHFPTIVVIEGHEFEEYEEPPVFGRQPTFAVKQLGADLHQLRSSRSAREISAEQLQSGPARSARKEARAAKRMKSSKCLSKLDTLADLAILDEKEQEQHPPAHSTTTKHPRHRPGCSCIVCIQPPSGQGPKHEPNCTCNVCLTVKRRFQTLMLRRKKLQSEKEAENDEGNHQCSPEKSEEKIEASDRKVVESERQGDEPIKNSDSSKNSGNGEGPLSCAAYNKEESGSFGKGQIDLNCQPEREEDFFPNSDLDGSSKPFNEYVWTGISGPSPVHEQQIEAHAADPVDGQSKDEANDGQELDWQGADAGVPVITNLSKPGPIPATTAA